MLSYYPSTLEKTLIMAITEAQHRNRLGRFILISNLVFGGLIVVYYLLRGFDDDEFAELMKLVIPIKTAYLTALTRYVVSNRHVVDTSIDENPVQINRLFASTSYIIISVHIIGLIAAVSLYALFNAMDFKDLINIIVALETIFGVYVGLIIASMFRVEDEKAK
jgi:hypothetical protein